MFTESIDKAHPSHKGTKPFQLLSFFIVLVFALSIHPAKAHAQIIGELEVNVPFQFYAGNAKLPAGKYVLHMLDNSDLRIMEISSAGRLHVCSVRSRGRRGELRASQERIDLQQVRQSLLPCEGF